MKVILSRKGFDSEYGGQPSPILPDGTLLSLPIPFAKDTVKYSDLQHGLKSYYEIVNELKPRNNQITQNSTAHLDPDIRHEVLRKRNENWKAIFGQAGAAETHLKNMKVAVGDIFLFFGWFKHTEYLDGRLGYKKGSPDLHIIYGYLQIGEIYNYGSKFPDYALDHSHCHPQFKHLNPNCIYVAKDNLSFNPSLKGANTLKFNPNLVLTRDGLSKSKWSVPDFFKDLSISYHNPDSFKEDYFQSVAKGQEFVISPNIKLTNWVKHLIESNL